MIALATALFEEKRKNSYLSKDISTPRTKKKGKYSKNTTPNEGKVPKWKFKYEGDEVEVEGVDYAWCEHHGHKDQTGKQSGMYMHAPHDHAKWAKRKAERISRGKEKGTGKEPKVTPKPPSNPSPKTSPKQSDGANGKLALAKSFKSVLTSNAQFSNEESDYIYSLAMKDVEEAESVD